MPELGAGLLVPSDSEGTAIVLAPDDPQAVAHAAVTLVTPGADTTHATIDFSDTQQCGDVALVPVHDAPSAWSAGFFGMHAQPLRMDSIEALSPRDSARVAADAARLASALTATASNRFRGLPFVVVEAYRFDVDSGQALVIHVVRRLNQEATPLEEHTLLIAEARGGSTAPFATVYSDRSEGSEETAEHFDALAALRSGRSVVLLIARDQVARTQYELLERTTDGTWRPRWHRVVSC
jgi:hypothetical protein